MKRVLGFLGFVAHFILSVTVVCIEFACAFIYGIYSVDAMEKRLTLRETLHAWRCHSKDVFKATWEGYFDK